MLKCQQINMFVCFAYRTIHSFCADIEIWAYRFLNVFLYTGFSAFFKYMSDNPISGEIPETIDAPESDYLYRDCSGIAGAGEGLYTAIRIYRNEVISVFQGERISDEEADKRVAAREDGYFVSMLDGSIMDARLVDGFAKYANDASGLSVGQFKNNALITLNEGGEVCLLALRNIRAGEEIFCSYGKRYWARFKDTH